MKLQSVLRVAENKPMRFERRPPFISRCCGVSEQWVAFLPPAANQHKVGQ